MGKRGAITPLFFVVKAVILLSLLLISSLGMGFSPVYLVGVSLLMGGLLVSNFARREYVAGGLVALYCILFLLWSPAAYSILMVVVLLLVSGKEREGVSLFVSQLPTLLSCHLALPVWVLHPAGMGIAFLAVYAILSIMGKVGRCRFYSVVCIIAALFILSVSWMSWRLDAVCSDAPNEGYGIGRAMRAITGHEPSGAGHLLYQQLRLPEIPQEGTLYLDHDAHTPFDDGNIQQAQPWSWNMLIAPENLRLAIHNDGAYISNIGARLHPGKFPCLISMACGVEVFPLVLVENKRLVISDSDWAIDCLAPYQANLIRALTGEDSLLKWYMLSLALCLFVYAARLHTKFVCGMVLVSLGVLVAYSLFPQDGLVRYVGEKRCWCHTELGEGIVRVLQQRGINATFGNRHSKILVVGEGATATPNHEKLVVMEPNSTLKTSRTSIKALPTPQGCVAGIPDARLISVDGRSPMAPPITVEGMKIIATGTPAALPAKFDESL